MGTHLKYTVKEKDGKKVIDGEYIPEGFTCLCKKCTYSIQVPKCTTDEQIQAIVDLIRRV
jgi:hypothetical protein